jgi:centrosomal protein CEP164
MTATILEERIDVNYEPEEEEVLEYAEWLGMDLEKDADLLWIPKAGLKTPLPYPWKPCRSHDTNEIFYFNFATGESVWDHPVDLHAQRQYRREVMKKNKPCFIVSLQHTIDEETGIVYVSCITMGGNTLLEVQLDTTEQTLLWLLRRVRTKIPKEPACRVKFLLANGQAVGKPESKVSLLKLLGLDEVPVVKKLLLEKQASASAQLGTPPSPRSLPAPRMVSKTPVASTLKKCSWDLISRSPESLAESSSTKCTSLCDVRCETLTEDHLALQVALQESFMVVSL